MRLLRLLLLLSLCFTAAAQTPMPSEQLTAAEVSAMIEAAVKADSSNDYFVVVVDRAGRILGAWQKPGATLETSGR